MPVYKPTYNLNQIESNLKSVFLAGSIEMDKADNWQIKCESSLSEYFNVLNPRRDSWDASWEQNIDNPEFKSQVDWELEALELADIIIMYFDPMTKSPISLLELGLFAKTGKMKVVCPEGFWRKGNVDVVCEKYNVEQFDNLDELLKSI